MKKNGFIATSLMFSFFIIFLTMTLMIMATYTQYQTLINNLNSNVLKDLNKYILEKNVILKNSVVDGNVASAKGSFNRSAWPLLYNATPVNDSENNSTYIKLLPTNSKLSNIIPDSNKIARGNRKIYVRFRIHRSTTLVCSSASADLVLGVDSYNITNNLCGDYTPFTPISTIINANNNSDSATVKFEIFGMRPVTNTIPLSTLWLSITDLMVVDITDLYESGTSDATVQAKLDTYLPYFDGSTTLRKDLVI